MSKESEKETANELEVGLGMLKAPLEDQLTFLIGAVTGLRICLNKVERDIKVIEDRLEKLP